MIPQIGPTNDNGPDGPIPLWKPSSVKFYCFQKSKGFFRLLRFAGEWSLSLQCPMPHREGETLRPHVPGRKSEIANAKRTFGNEGMMPAAAPKKDQASFLKLV